VNELRIDVDQVDNEGAGFSRPECVLCTSNGDIFASHLGASVRHIAADGRSKILGRPGPGAEFVPNGIALLPDGSLLVANMGEQGCVWKIDLNDKLLPFLSEAEGRPLDSANFVAVDQQGRIWITISTQTHPRFDAYNKSVADGFIVLHDRSGTRIVADGLAFTNECRLSPDGAWLYVSETSAQRVSRFKVAGDGSLRQREVFAQFGVGTFPDGIDFDAEDNLWVTSIVSNRIIRIAPDGTQQIILEDSDPEHVAWVDEAQKAGKLAREHFYTTRSRKLSSITSVAFGGPELKTVYLGSLASDSLMTFRSPVAGRKPVHWEYRRSF
jgi:sugar lactone lactonase YvrE